MAKLGEVFVLIRNGASIKQTNGADGIPITRIETISNRKVDRNKFGYAGIHDIQKYSDYILQHNDILMSHINSEKHLGKAAIYEKQEDDQIIHGMNLLMLRADSQFIWPKYALYYFETPFFQQKIIRITKKSVNQASFTVTALKEVEIPLPAVEVQKNIADILDKVANLISLRKQQLAKLDELVKARFVEMFGDLMRNNMNWPILSFSDFAIIDTTMIYDFQEYGDYPHIGIDSIEKETGNLTGYRSVKEDNVISGKYLFTPKHIIYSKIRPNLNKVALPDFVGVCSADAYPILPKEGVCNREFLGYTLRSVVFLDYILEFSNRTNLPKVNKQQVEGFCCPIPDWRFQKQFASFVAQVNKRKQTIQQSLDKLEMLKKTLMQEYFG